MRLLLGYSLMVVVLAVAGAALPMIARKRAKKKGDATFRLFVSFGAGVLLGTAFLHMIPHAAEHSGDHVGFWILLGFLFLYLLESLSFSHSCGEHQCRYHTIGHVAVAGLALHNFVNGVALGSAVQFPALGLWVFFATAAHKMPEFFSLSSILLAGKRRPAFVLATCLGVSLVLMAGALLAGSVLSHVGPSLLGAALGFSAGTFLHIATSDLVPEVHHLRQARWAHLGAFLTGLALMALSALFEMPGGH